MPVRLNSNAHCLLDLLRAAKLTTPERRVERVGKVMEDHRTAIQDIKALGPTGEVKAKRETSEFLSMIRFALNDPRTTPAERSVLNYALDLL